MTTATATRSRIRYLAYWQDVLLGEGSDRFEADDLIYRHANRNQHPITEDYRVDVQLRKEGK